MASFCTLFSKYWIGFFSLLLLLAGIAIAIISLTVFNLDEIVPNENYADINKILTWVIVGLAVILIEISILGILLIWSKSKCISLLYSIQLVLLFIIFAGAAIGIYIGFEKVNDKITCDNLSILEDADKIFKDGNKLLCSQNCVCQATEKWLQTYLDSKNMIYSTTKGSLRVQDCKNYDEYLGGSYDNMIKSVKWIEENLDCSGICTISGFYLYSNINSDVQPKKACLNSIKDKISDISKTISYITGAVALILLITLICNFVVCCQKRKQGKPKGEQYKDEEMQQMKK